MHIAHWRFASFEQLWKLINKLIQSSVLRGSLGALLDFSPGNVMSVNARLGRQNVPTAQLVLEDAEGGIEGLVFEIGVLNAGAPPKDAVEKYTEWESLLADKTSVLEALLEGPSLKVSVRSYSVSFPILLWISPIFFILPSNRHRRSAIVLVPFVFPELED